MSLYLDTSCFLKLFFPEPESARVAELVAQERQVVVSTLGKLEALVQIDARVHGGLLTRSKATRLLAQLSKVLASSPFELVSAPPQIIEVAKKQLETARSRAPCRTLDRLHLAVMSELQIGRLFTNDDRQAAAARAAGLEVLLPR